MGRFDYVKYDEATLAAQNVFKKRFEELEELVNALSEGRAKSLVHTKLEEAYMWIGKALRDEQVSKSPGELVSNNLKNELNESRG